MADADPIIENYLDSQREAEVGFLAELVRMPSDNPPGDCAAHAERAERVRAKGVRELRQPTLVPRKAASSEARD